MIPAVAVVMVPSSTGKGSEQSLDVTWKLPNGEKAPS